jgi:hypothetical protein
MQMFRTMLMKSIIILIPQSLYHNFHKLLKDSSKVLFNHNKIIKQLTPNYIKVNTFHSFKKLKMLIVKYQKIRKLSLIIMKNQISNINVKFCKKKYSPKLNKLYFIFNNFKE